MKINVLIIILLFISCKNDRNVGRIKEKQYTTEQIEFLNLKNKDIMREKFDFELYEKESKVSEGHYVKPNGNIVLGIGWRQIGYDYDKSVGGYIQEQSSKIPFIRIYKTFYIDGYIKEKRYILGEYLNIGTSEYYDKYGKLTQFNEDTKFGKIKPNDVLEFIEKQGIINLKTGEGFFIGHSNDAQLSFYISFGKPRDFKLKNNYYIIGLKNKGKSSEIDTTGGEPPVANDLIYYMDSETGKVFTKEELKESQKSTYKTHNGKTYTEEEWKIFEEQEYQKYLENKNKKSFWDKLFG